MNSYIRNGGLDADLYSLRRTIAHMKASPLMKADEAFSREVCKVECAYKELETYVEKRIGKNS